MQLMELNTLLKENAYPGRGIVIGQSADGTAPAPRNAGQITENGGFPMCSIMG